MTDSSFNAIITNEGIEYARQASTVSGWYLIPKRWGISATQGSLITSRTTSSMNTTWVGDTFSDITASGTNTLLHSLIIPPTVAGNHVIGEIYFIYTDYYGNEFLYAIAQPKTSMEYVEGTSQTFKFSFTLNNAAVSDTFIIDYTYPQDIEDHNNSEFAHSTLFNQGAASTIIRNNLSPNLALVSNISGKVATTNTTTSELNVLHGITATTSELNVLHGAIINTTELNYLDNVSSNIQTQLNNLNNGKMNTDMSNMDNNARYRCRELFWFNNTYMVGDGWVNNDAPGWVIFDGYSGEGVHCWGNVNGITVWRNDQSGGGGRAGAMGSAGISWIQKGGWVNFSSASCRFIRCANF